MDIILSYSDKMVYIEYLEILTWLADPGFGLKPVFQKCFQRQITLPNLSNCWWRFYVWCIQPYILYKLCTWLWLSRNYLRPKIDVGSTIASFRKRFNKNSLGRYGCFHVMSLPPCWIGIQQRFLAKLPLSLQSLRISFTSLKPVFH